VGKIGAYTLKATSGSLSVLTTSFTLGFGAATQLAVTTPSGAVNAVAFTGQPVVTAQDSGLNTVTTYATAVALAINTQPGTGAVLSGCNVPTWSSGVATFSGCQIVGKIGGYTLTATSGTLTVNTPIFTLTVGTMTKIGFTTNPASATYGTMFAAQPVVAAQDSGGNTIVGYTTPAVTLSITAQPGSGGALSGCNAPTWSSGVSTFTGCSITGTASTTAGSYTLTATSGTYTATSTVYLYKLIRQVVATSTTAASTMTVGPLSAAPASGDTLVLSYSSTAATHITGVTNNGRAFTHAGQSITANGDAEIWYLPLTAAGVTSTVITFSGSTSEVDIANVSEWAGLGVPDATGTASLSGTTAGASAGTVTPTTPNDLAFSVAYVATGGTTALVPTNAFAPLTQGTVTASLYIRGLAAYYAVPGLAVPGAGNVSTTWNSTAGRWSSTITAFVP